MKSIKNGIAKILRLTIGRKPKYFKNIPIIINNYNRLTTLKKLTNYLEINGYTNIYILDNQSSYPPLLDFYQTCEYRVFSLKKNYGSKALWKSGIWLKFMFSNFVYTDSDVLPVDECPNDFLEYFYKLLVKYPNIHKVGFSIKIDDLPDTFINKSKVINWEKRYYNKEIENNIYLAPIDTTFALYRPFSKSGRRDDNAPILRVGFPYQIRHLPWYIDNNKLDLEEEFYINSLKKRTHWSRQN